MNLNFDHLEESTRDYIDIIRQINPQFDLPAIEKAYRFAWESHKGQKRKSGEPYICHPAAVSIICAEQSMDSTTIIATLLHDVIEDTPVSNEELTAEFGTTVAQLVEGVTKISHLHMEDKATRQMETYRKMLLTTAQDIRVIIIKFADRIHNLRTLDYMIPEKKKSIAEETLNIYAPLANRLGMRNIKTELEDLSFRHRYPEDYEEILSIVSAGQHQRDEVIESFRVPLVSALLNEGLDSQVFGRSKHFYSIFLKNRNRKVPYNEIFDLLAMRVICTTREECYRTLGIVHSLWTPLPDKLKDYIASPKSNGYQSIHTTVAGPNGNIIEIQIRTWEMNYLAEEGVAAHWRYKGVATKSQLQESSPIQWLRNLVEWQKEFSDAVEFYEFFKIDISHNEITVRTPTNQEISLSKGATALDFAFAIHSEIGIHCIGAKVNGTVEKPSVELHNGDVVEILHSFDKKPSLKWLQETRTPRARSAIKRWFHKAEKSDRISIGKKLLYTSYNKLHYKRSLASFMQMILSHFSLDTEEQLYDRIGSAKLEVKSVLDLVKQKNGIDPGASVNRLVNNITGNTPKVVVNGMESVMIRYAPCCHPLPGDTIIGFLTSGRGISVHRRDCAHAKIFANDQERAVTLSWHDDNVADMTSGITLQGGDRKGLIREISEVIEKRDINISDMEFTTSGQRAKVTLKVEVKSLNQLKKLKKELSKIRGINRVTRNAL